MTSPIWSVAIYFDLKANAASRGDGVLAHLTLSVGFLGREDDKIVQILSLDSSDDPSYVAWCSIGRLFQRNGGQFDVRE